MLCYSICGVSYGERPVAFKKVDLAAIVLSGLCVLHCLSVPLLVSFAPFVFATGGNDELVHSLFFFIALPLSALGFWQGFRRHGVIFIPALGALGLLLMGYDLRPLVHDLDHSHNLTLPGVLLVAAAHLWNIRSIRQRALA